MPHRSRIAALIVASGCLFGTTACASNTAPSGTGALGAPRNGPATTGAPSAPAGPSSGPATTPASGPATSSPAGTATTKPPAPKPAAALTCSQTKEAMVGSTTISYNGYHDSIPLGGGVWSGEDGTTVTLKPPCGIGDLDGDGAKDAVGAIVATTGGSGQFWTLVVWRNVNHKPVFWALNDLGDRNPVTSISISGKVATVVYCTRTDDQPMAVVNIKRTAKYQLFGHKFLETSHQDDPGILGP